MLVLATGCLHDEEASGPQLDAKATAALVREMLIEDNAERPPRLRVAEQTIRVFCEPVRLEGWDYHCATRTRPVSDPVGFLVQVDDRALVRTRGIP